VPGSAGWGGCSKLGIWLDKGWTMATNRGGARKGAVKNRFQLHNPKTDRWSAFSLDGGLLRTKKSKGPYKGIKKGPPKGR
jgi:hypothetical protein